MVAAVGTPASVAELRMSEVVPLVWEYLRRERAAYVRELARYVGDAYGLPWHSVLGKVSRVLARLRHRRQLNVRTLEPTPHNPEVLKYDDYKLYYFRDASPEEVEEKYRLVRFVCDLGWSLARRFEELAYEAAVSVFGVARVRRSEFTSPQPDLQIGGVPDFIEVSLRHLNPLDKRYVETHLRRLPPTSYGVVHGIGQHVLFVALAVVNLPENRWLRHGDGRVYYRIVRLFPERSEDELPLFGEFVGYKEHFERVWRRVFVVSEEEVRRRFAELFRSS